MHSGLTLGLRVLRQLTRDVWFLIFSLAAPVLIIVVMKMFFDTFPDQFPVQDYIVGIAATVVFIITFVLSMISVVEERVNGTLQRMFINGVSRTTIIVGYILGYLVLATVQACIVVFMTLALFDLDYGVDALAWLFLSIWLLALASVALGLFISSFVKRQVQIIPFIPLILIPSIFLSGIIVDINDLPAQAQVVGKAMPLHYANNVVEAVTGSAWDASSVLPDVLYLALIVAVIVALASRTLRPVQ